jgi:flagellar basal-body rod modification protein FlgD
MTTTAASSLTSAAMSALSSTAPTSQVGTQANNPQMNQFLQLLTTQLQNQDPMQPTDPTQFVAQLAQFSTVEQLVQGNTTLGTMNTSLSGLASGQYAGMIGHSVTANVTSLTVPASGTVSQPMSFQLSSTALTNARVAITNSSGTVVGTLPVSGSSGTVTFNGTTSNGQTLPAGQYTVSLVGTDSTGATQTAGTLTSAGTVSSIAQNSGGAWQLQLSNGSSVAASSVVALD